MSGKEHVEEDRGLLFQKEGKAKQKVHDKAEAVILEGTCKQKTNTWSKLVGVGTRIVERMGRGDDLKKANSKTKSQKEPQLGDFRKDRKGPGALLGK